MEIILYGNGCPKCLIMERLLNRKGCEFDKESDLTEIMELGFKQVPILKVDGKMMDFSEGCKWISGR